ncbi:LPXTG cell wall anchor domain-containing protein [Epidermidibacterium keratini]|uniref:LPXTG cell wall anchor domain-containing protein n=1 Tax=Epidermidibacterium keratini TaxID=1891644 RepID=A0A7L4YR43_9ACTN|nr:LPXTG cell wall anchor domain-containing protein [Epidermidibacterium keratini]QHC01384.1 LPXTG cell wall anchor domain-containing protein [Epidermidibacterium keratini]
MTVTRKLVTATASGALGFGVVLAGASGAFAADLPAPTVNPSPVDTSAAFTLSGAGCITDGGTTGTISATLIYPDGHDEYTGPYSVDADGTWSVEYSPNDSGAVPPGTYTINAVCDLYTGKLTYGAVQFMAQDEVADPAARVNDSTVTAGQQVTVTAVGLQSGQQVTVTFDDPNVTFGTGTVGLDGTVSITGVIPQGTGLGGHLITVVAADGTRLTVPIQVVAPGTPGTATTPPVSGGGSTVDVSTSGTTSTPKLANTGTDAAMLGWLAAGLLASGGAALYAGHRGRKDDN